jgi:uncharacterized repeat protein (TIGR02543 family)
MDLLKDCRQNPPCKGAGIRFLVIVLLLFFSTPFAAHAGASSADPKGSLCLTDNEIQERNDLEIGSSYLSIELPNPIDTSTSVNDFTIASWLKITKINPGGALVMGMGQAHPFGAAGFSILLDGNPGGGNGYFALGYATTEESPREGMSPDGSLPEANQWFHLAVVRHSGVITIYKDGTSFVTLANAISFTSTTFKIGIPQDGIADGFPGCYSGLVQANSALYTSDFSSNLPYPEDMPTPPSAQVLLNPNFSDPITSWNKVTGGPAISKVGEVRMSSDIPVPRVIIYNTNGAVGTAPSSSTSPGSPINLPLGTSLSKSGYDFGGWSLSETGTAETSPFTPLTSRTLYAVWNFNEEAAARAAAEAQAASEAAAQAAAEAQAASEAAAQAAAEKREAEKRNARAELISKAVNKRPLSVSLFAKAEISGVTLENLVAVETEIHELPDSSRSEINQIIRIARKFEVVSLIGSDRARTLLPNLYVEIGLIPGTSKNKTSLVNSVRNLPSSARDSYAEIKAAIDFKAAEFQIRTNRLVDVLARQSNRSRR